MWHADGSLQHSQTSFLLIIVGSIVNISLIVLVIGFPTAHATLRNMAEDALLSSGVYAMYPPWVFGVEMGSKLCGNWE
jgi:hypothetical protein